MTKQILIIGAGFGGVWSALSAKYLLNREGRDQDVEVTVVAPESSMVIRPRLYEANPSDFKAPLGALFDSAGVKFVKGFADNINVKERTVQIKSSSGELSKLSYDRLVLAAGSGVIRPQAIAGRNEYAFDIDSLDAAVELEARLQQLEALPRTADRETVVVCGGGFTGIEMVTELPKRLAGMAQKPRLVLVDNATEIGASLGPGPRPIITQAMESLGIEVKLGSGIASIDSEGVTLASGERIEAKTVIWTAGVRATPLTKQIPGEKDRFERLQVDKHLRVPSCSDVFATGDAAAAKADADGHYAMMSCQHGLTLGRVSGYNAAADLLEVEPAVYSQPEYVTCLDLGAFGTVVTYGWDRDVKLTGDIAKRVKHYINQKLIYPSQDAKEAIALAEPNAVADSSELFQQVVQAVVPEGPEREEVMRSLMASMGK